jgi:crossover junction endodeoxyribonuclease RusA
LGLAAQSSFQYTHASVNELYRCCTLLIRLSIVRLEFVIDGPPVSQQARRRDRVREWQEEIRRVAALSWLPAELPLTGPVILTITYFYDTVSIDVDNIPKPISDALQGLVYVNDDQITDVICRKRNLNGSLRVENPSLILAEGLNRGNDFLYIVVEESSEHEVIR